MTLILQLPDNVAEAFASHGDLSRQALEALSLEGYRQKFLTQLQVGQMLGLSRIETENFLANHVDLYNYSADELEAEATLLQQLSRR